VTRGVCEKMPKMPLNSRNFLARKNGSAKIYSEKTLVKNLPSAPYIDW
jgi:hypothetical protein